jgi:hypothetical protein
MMDPIAITVAGEDPEMAAKNIQARTEEMANPPRVVPKTVLPIRIRRSEIFPEVIMFPQG